MRSALDLSLDALLAFRHGDTKHLTWEHASLLYDAVQNQRAALHKIGSAYPCSTAKDMARVATDALGITVQQLTTEK